MAKRFEVEFSVHALVETGDEAEELMNELEAAIEQVVCPLPFTDGEEHVCAHDWTMGGRTGPVA